MTPTSIKNVRLLESGKGISKGSLSFLDGSIVAQVSALTTLDGKDFLLTPGCIDIHTHGIEQYLYEVSPEQFLAATTCLARHGTTSVCPTLYTVMDHASLGKLEILANTIDQVTDVCIPGLHLEGPFLGLPGAGAMTLDGDVGLLNELLAATGNRVAVMSIGPEQKNIVPVIERLVEAGVMPLITHTRADIDQTQKAIDAGARHATHFYDVFHVPGPANSGVRPVGAVEVILADRRCTVDFIA
ncbi:MAG: amidohydrolase family protein, partial [Phycisphaeraceae bacterium]|nr:amidohydrolase family protein [Phycisphaeraceae bacterium]